MATGSIFFLLVSTLVVRSFGVVVGAIFKFILVVRLCVRIIFTLLAASTIFIVLDPGLIFGVLVFGVLVCFFIVIGIPIRVLIGISIRLILRISIRFLLLMVFGGSTSLFVRMVLQLRLVRGTLFVLFQLPCILLERILVIPLCLFLVNFIGSAIFLLVLFIFERCSILRVVQLSEFQAKRMVLSIFSAKLELGTAVV